MKKQGKVVEFDPEAAHAASVMKDEANIIDLGSKTAIGDIEENDRGGKQSKIKGRMTEVPPLALIEVSAVMAEGASNYPRNEDGTPNWHSIDCASNLDHAMEHVANFLAERNKPKLEGYAGRYADQAVLREELSHAASRMMMALEQFIREEL